MAKDLFDDNYGESKNVSDINWDIQDDTLYLYPKRSGFIPSIGDTEDFDRHFAYIIDGAREYPWAYAKDFIKTIKIDCVSNIPEGAFEGFSALEKVYMPFTVRYIEDRAFKDCTNLSEVYIDTDFPDIVKSALKQIGEEAFYNCSSLKDFQFSITKDLKNIGFRAFSHSGLDSFVELPKGTNIEKLAFAYTPITDIKLNNNIVGEATFTCCESLKQIEAENSVFEKDSFGFCNELNGIESSGCIYKRDSIYECPELDSLHCDHDIIEKCAIYRCSNDMDIQFGSDGNRPFLATDSIITCERARELSLREENMAL